MPSFKKRLKLRTPFYEGMGVCQVVASEGVNRSKVWAPRPPERRAGGRGSRCAATGSWGQAVGRRRRWGPLFRGTTKYGQQEDKESGTGEISK